MDQRGPRHTKCNKRQELTMTALEGQRFYYIYCLCVKMRMHLEDFVLDMKSDVTVQVIYRDCLVVMIMF
jgi:hypothetical protein